MNIMYLENQSGLYLEQREYTINWITGLLILVQAQTSFLVHWFPNL